MAQAKQCDRCQKFYKYNHCKTDRLMSWRKKETGSVAKIAVIDNQGDSLYYDLCDDCLRILDYFLSNKEIKLQGVI